MYFFTIVSKDIHLDLLRLLLGEWDISLISQIESKREFLLFFTFLLSPNTSPNTSPVRHPTSIIPSISISTPFFFHRKYSEKSATLQIVAVFFLWECTCASIDFSKIFLTKQALPKSIVSLCYNIIIIHPRNPVYYA